jgi:FkbM family methyltransferase
MKTAHKIALARIAYETLRSARKLAGKNDRCVVRRGGLTFELDLAEGIDFAIYLGNVFERQTRRAISRLTEASATVLDIGANVGAHTLHLARCVGPAGKVHAFEPTGFAYRKLSRNITLNRSLEPRIIAHHCFLAASDQTKVPTSIYSSWPLIESDRAQTADGDIHSKHLGQAMPTESAAARSIDNVLFESNNPPVQLVKLDVDGFECEVLRGADTLLRESRPIFVMELAPYVLDERGASLAELVDMFRRYNYRFYDERTNRLLAQTAVGISNTIRDGESINVIARAD